MKEKQSPTPRPHQNVTYVTIRLGIFIALEFLLFLLFLLIASLFVN